MPKIAIAALAGKYNSIQGSNVALKGAGDDSYTYVWSLVDADVSISSVLESGGGSGDAWTRKSATVNVHALTADTTYTFRMTATDSSGTSGYSNVELVVNGNPASGTLNVSPESGYTMTTGFDYVALGWCDEDLPLTYKYSYTVVTTTSSLDASTPLADEMSSASLTGAVLPPGTESSCTPDCSATTPTCCSTSDGNTNYTVVGQVSVSDSFGAHASATDTVRVLPVDSFKFNTSLADEYLQSNNGEGSLQILGASHALINSDSTSRRRRLLADSSSEASRDAMLETLFDTFAITDVTDANMETMLSTLDGICEVPRELSVNAGRRSFELCNNVLESLVDEGVGLSTASGAYTGDVLSQLMDSNVFNDTQAGDRHAAIQNVTKTLNNAVTAGLLDTTTGVSFSIDSDYITMLAVREETVYMDGAVFETSANLQVAFQEDFSGASWASSYADDDLVDAKTVEITHSMYPSSESLMSNALQITLFTETGAEIEVSGLTQGSDEQVRFTVATDAFDIDFEVSRQCLTSVTMVP